MRARAVRVSTRKPKLHPLYQALVANGCVLCSTCHNYMPVIHLCARFVSGALRLDPTTGEWGREQIMAKPGRVEIDPAFALQAIEAAEIEARFNEEVAA